MIQDEELGSRLRRAADDVSVDPERALERFHGSRSRRHTVRRRATIATALVIAVVGLAIVWLGRPIGSRPIPPTATNGPSGTIAYMDATKDGSDVTANGLTIGSLPWTIVDAPFADYPVWSPDGSSIAYGAGPDFDRTTLTVANADGSDPISIGRSAIRGAFGWSPDGTRLAYLHDDPQGVTGVYVANADGSGETLAIEGTWQSVSWSPDGRLLLLAGHPGTPDNIAGPEGFDLYTVDPDGNELQQLTHTTEYEHLASWSPDGTRIVFTRSPEFDDADYPQDVFVMDADGSNVRQLTDRRGFDSFPVWSPDGKWIAFTSDRDATPVQQETERAGDAFGPNSLYVMRADGSDVQLLLVAGEHQTFAPTSWRNAS
jgi:Tol biopolymer transport system component